MSQPSPLERINYSGDLTPLMENVCADYYLGVLSGYELITVGYEDCNVKFESEKGTYLAKILSKERDPQNIKRYEGILQCVSDSGISTPVPLLAPRGGLLYSTKGQNIVVQEFVEGETFYKHKDPSDAELLDIMEQAHKISSIDYRPTFLKDIWAVSSIDEMYANIKDFLSDDESSLVEAAAHLYGQIPLSDLPYAFVHGDIISTNVVKSISGEIYILDFSAANWYPRMQELAVMASSLLAEGTLNQRCERVAAAYESFSHLQKAEKKYLYTCALSAVAMEFIGACYEKFVNGNLGPENQHWLNLGLRELENEIKL